MPVFAILVSKAILKTPSAKQCHRYGVMIHYRRVLDFLDSILIGLYTDSVVDSRLCLFVTVSCTLTYRWYTLLDVSRFLSRFCRGVELYLALAGQVLMQESLCHSGAHRKKVYKESSF